MPKGCDLSPIEHVWPLIKQELWNYQFSEERGHLNPLTYGEIWEQIVLI